MEQNESVRFRIQITAKDLWMFSMYHSNKGYLGVFNLFFTLASLWLLVTRWSDVTVAYRILLLICVLMFTVWSSLYESGQTGKNQSRERAHGHDLQRRRDTDRTG